MEDQPDVYPYSPESLPYADHMSQIREAVAVKLPEVGLLMGFKSDFDTEKRFYTRFKPTER